MRVVLFVAILQCFAVYQSESIFSAGILRLLNTTASFGKCVNAINRTRVSIPCVTGVTDGKPDIAPFCINNGLNKSHTLIWKNLTSYKFRSFNATVGLCDVGALNRSGILDGGQVTITINTTNNQFNTPWVFNVSDRTQYGDLVLNTGFLTGSNVITGMEIKMTSLGRRNPRALTVFSPSFSTSELQIILVLEYYENVADTAPSGYVRCFEDGRYSCQISTLTRAVSVFYRTPALDGDTGAFSLQLGSESLSYFVQGNDCNAADTISAFTIGDLDWIDNNGAGSLRRVASFTLTETTAGLSKIKVGTSSPGCLTYSDSLIQIASCDGCLRCHWRLAIKPQNVLPTC